MEKIERKARLIMVAAILLPLLTGCASAPVANHIRLGMADTGKTFNLAKGGTLEIALKGNPTTGYLWSLLSANNAVLRPAGDSTYQRDEAPAGMMGVGGQFVFRFQAVGAGATQLKLGYQRPWEKNKPPSETFEVNINVQ